jgi:hypothetical protein
MLRAPQLYLISCTPRGITAVYWGVDTGVADYNLFLTESDIICVETLSKFTEYVPNNGREFVLED